MRGLIRELACRRIESILGTNMHAELLLKPRLTAVWKNLPNVIFVPREFALLLRLTEAHSGARVCDVCDPQRVAVFGCRKLLLATAMLCALMATAIAADENTRAKSEDARNKTALQVVDLRGRIVCLPEAMHELYGIDLPTNHQHIWGFKSTDGTFYTLLRTKLSEALFVDEQVRKKELILKGHVLPKTQIFEMTDMKSVRNGVIYDLYYYCDVCSIKTLSPGPCMCCQGPVKLVEKRPE